MRGNYKEMGNTARETTTRENGMQQQRQKKEDKRKDVLNVLKKVGSGADRILADRAGFVTSEPSDTEEIHETKARISSGSHCGHMLLGTCMVQKLTDRYTQCDNYIQK